MVFLINSLTLALGMGMIALTRRYLGKGANYIAYFNLLWVAGAIFTGFGLYNSFIPPVRIYLYIFFMLLSFNLTTFILMTMNLNLKNYTLSNEESFVSKGKFNSILYLLLLVFLIIFMLPPFMQSVSYIITNGYSELRSETLTAKTLTQWILYHYGHPLLLAIMIINTIEVVFYRRNYLVYFIGLINVVMYITIFASRWLLTECILLLVLSLSQKYGNRIFKLIRRNKIIAVFMIAGISLILYITTQRSLTNASIMQNIYYYFFGSINCLGMFSQHLDLILQTNSYLYGQAFFSGLVQVISDFLRMDIETGIMSMNKIIQNYVYVSPTIRMNNNVTMLYSFIADFGWVGLIVYPSLIALFLFRCYKKALLKTKNLNLSIYIYTFSLLLFGIVEWFPARDTVITTYLFLWLLASKKIVWSSKVNVGKTRTISTQKREAM